MADYTTTQLGITTTTLVSLGSTLALLPQSTASFTLEVSNGTVSLGNLDLSSNQQTADYLRAKRPQLGLLYPRRVKY
jgi:hypothetical protein